MIRMNDTMIADLADMAVSPGPGMNDMMIADIADMAVSPGPGLALATLRYESLVAAD